MSSTQQWFVNLNEQVNGPFSAVQLKQLAQSGQINEATLVCLGSEGQWVPASQVKGLCDVAPPAAQASQPAATAAISDPRTPPPLPASALVDSGRPAATPSVTPKTSTLATRKTANQRKTGHRLAGPVLVASVASLMLGLVIGFGIGRQPDVAKSIKDAPPAPPPEDITSMQESVLVSVPEEQIAINRESVEARPSGKDEFEQQVQRQITEEQEFEQWRRVRDEARRRVLREQWESGLLEQAILARDVYDSFESWPEGKPATGNDYWEHQTSYSKMYKKFLDECKEPLKVYGELDRLGSAPDAPRWFVRLHEVGL